LKLRRLGKTNLMISEVGFGGEIWPCFDEFVDNEYKVFEAIAKA